MPNFKLALCYDGSRYKGWQRQGNTDNTVQAKTESVLSRILNQNIEIAASGRTDAGVHARYQVCSFRADTDMKCEDILTELRKYLPEDIGAINLEPAPPRFHARLNCKEKTYVYRIWNSGEPNVFRRKYMYNLPAPLDVPAMSEGAQAFLGRHDFTAFCSNKHMKKSAVRTITAIRIEKTGNEITMTFTGDGFLYNMVRIIVGTLIQVGLGERDISTLPDDISSLQRENAGPTAPAQGLYLWDVKY